jgi:polyphosphate kinase
MTRNLDHRIEVVLPILDDKVKKQLLQMMELQWKDNVKARIFNETQSNIFRTRTAPEKAVRSQDAIYDYWKDVVKKKDMIMQRHLLC